MDFFFRFLKRPLTGKFSKFCFERIHHGTDRRVVFKFVKFGPREIGKIVRCLPDKKTKLRIALQILLLRRSRPKSARASLGQYTQSDPNFIHIGSRLVELYRNA